MNPSEYSASDWVTCTGTNMEKATAVRIVQPADQGTGEGFGTAGTLVNLELKPVNNKIDNNYLMWLGPIYVNGDARSMVWPVNDVVVASGINGYVYWDQWGKGQDRTETSPGIEGVVVRLLDKNSDPVLDENNTPWTATTNEDGYYEFPKEFHSGEYYTMIEQATTGSQEGKVPAQVGSHFYLGKMIDVVQTFSYKNQRLDKAKTTSTIINLGLDETLENVNFGFSAPDPYSDLMKSASKVNCTGDAIQCDVTWDVTVKNGGTPFDQDTVKMAIGIWPNNSSNGSGVVTTSGDYYIVKNTGAVTKASLPTGETVVSAIGSQPPNSYYGSGVVTASGDYYIVDGTGAVTKASLPTGETVVSANGDHPADSSNGSGVVTASGNYYIVKNTGAVTKASLPTGETVVSAIGSQPAKSTNGSGVVTASGDYYIVKNTGAVTKATPTGETVVSAIGDWPAISTYGSGVVTASGDYYIVNGFGVATKAALPTGESVVSAIGNSPAYSSGGSGVVTTSGDYYIVDNTGAVTKATPDEETVVSAIGHSPADSSYGGSGVVTASGDYYIIDGTGTATKSDSPWITEPPEFTGTPVTLTGGKLTDSTSSVVYDFEAIIGTKVVQVSAGNNYSLAVDSAGNVWAWGYNNYGQLGDDGTTDLRDTPVQVKGVGGTGFLSGIVQVSAGGNHSLAVDSAGNVWAWGRNSSGQLGDETTTQRNTPVQVKGGTQGTGHLSGIVQVSAGSEHSLAVDSNGNVWAWGNGGSGRLGDETTDSKKTPVQVKAGTQGTGNLSGIVQVSAGGTHSLAVDSSGNVWAWGNGGSGKLGVGTSSQHTTPVQVLGVGGIGFLSGIVQVSAGSSHSLAVDSSGNVWAWGYNSSGQLGDGTNAQRDTPVRTLLTLDRTVLPLLTESQNGDFTTREYKLPNLAPGEEVTVTLTGKVNRPNFEANNGKGLVIGNQAWESYKETPRTAPALPNPNLPSYNKDKPYDYGKWTGSSSCTATPGWVVPGDQCDQVWAQLEPTTQKLGSLSGYVFWDKSRSGTQDSTDPMVVGAKAYLYKGSSQDFSNKVGEAITDGSGFYKFDNLVPGSDYYVAFTPEQNPTVSSNGGSTTSSMLEPGQSWVYTTQYTGSPYYAVNKSAANNDGFTSNVAVVANQDTQPVNAGLAVYEASINVDKGFMVEGELKKSVEAELDSGNPGYYKPIPVTVKVTNNGSEPLDNLEFVDTNHWGPKVAWKSCSIDSAYEESLENTSWDGNTFTHIFADTSTVLNVSEDMICEGTIAAVSTDESPVHSDKVEVSGTGTITGTTVRDDSDFSVEAVSPGGMPTPEIKIEKGIISPLGDDTDCSIENNAKDENLCEIVSGSEASPTEIEINKETKITFRITNKGPESLLDPALDDTTTIGGSDVENITCTWPQKDVGGKTRNYLGTTSPDNVGICTGTLTIPDMGAVHQNQAEIFAVGETSRKLATDDAEFNAKTGLYDPPSVSLPLTGGRSAALFLIIASVIGAGSAIVYKRSRKREL